jgi:formylmethanofuran dehydrogenase subunit E
MDTPTPTTTQTGNPMELPQVTAPGSLDDVIRFHGHLCPGLTMGVQVARIALREIGPHAQDEEIVAVVETDMCGVDAIQFMTGCTFGKGNLIHVDHGKNAYTFHRRSDGRAIRVVAKPEAWRRDPEHQALRAKVKSGEATAEERDEFQRRHRQLAMDVLERDPYDMYEVTEVDRTPPARARIHTSIPCGLCGEGTMETRIRLLRGQRLCPACFDRSMGGRT